MKILDTCRQITDTESGRVLLYRDEVEAVLTAGDTISRRQAIDALGDEPEVWSGKDEYAQGLNNQWHYDRNAIKALPSAQPQDIAQDIARIIENEKDMRVIAKNAQPERKTGRWIYGENDGQDGWYCSECKGFIPWDYDFYGLNNIDFIKDFKTCPFCDSKMISCTGSENMER